MAFMSTDQNTKGSGAWLEAMNWLEAETVLSAASVVVTVTAKIPGFKYCRSGHGKSQCSEYDQPSEYDSISLFP
jgi:hypothetical protein